MTDAGARVGAVGRGRTHYPALDGLRGIAALSVVLFHIGHWIHIPMLATNSGLAVDFFFCLSGYVLALAYQGRLDAGMAPTRFLRIRLIRLMPLIMAATVISFLFVLTRPFLKHEYISPLEAALALGLGLLNLPYFGASKVIGGPQVFPLNGPQYSLFLEIVVNLFWSATHRVNSFKFSIAVVVISLLGVARFGFGGDETTNFWHGLPRVGLSFYLGVLAFQLDGRMSGWVKRDGLFWICAATMILLFFMPKQLPFTIDLIWVVIVAPLLVLAGAGVGLGARGNAVALLLGELSYPIYALHYPIFCWVNGAYQIVAKHPNRLVESAAILGAVLIGSYGALRLFDRPVRALLSRGARRPAPAI